MSEPSDDRFTDEDLAYTRHLQGKNRWWKRLIGVERWYGRRAARECEGRTLEVGCGTGRLLSHLGPDAIGVDTNPHSVEVASVAGLNAMSVDEFLSSDLARGEQFDSLLFAHVLEHMTNDQASALLANYLDFLRPHGRIVVIVPQEAGFASEPSHVASVDRSELEKFASDHRLELRKVSSFPFPRTFGRVFKYNETIAVFQKARV